jgi:hypothetical protein
MLSCRQGYEKSLNSNHITSSTLLFFYLLRGTPHSQSILVLYMVAWGTISIIQPTRCDQEFHAIQLNNDAVKGEGISLCIRWFD